MNVQHASFTPVLWMTLLAGLTLSSSQALAKTPRSSKSLYKVSWHDASVARVSLNVGCPTDKYTPAALIASSTGLADDLHSFSIRLDSFLSLANTLLPLQGRTRITEEERTRSYISSFDDASVEVKSNIFGKKKTHTHTLPEPSHDLLSWMFAVSAELADTSFTSATYTVWDGWKLVKIKATRQTKTSSITTPLATYKGAHVISLERTRIDSSGKPTGDASSLGTLWFSDAPSPQLVAMDFESRVGLANIRLVKHSSSTCKTSE